MSNKIVKFCRKLGIYNYTINDDGSVDVDGDVDFSDTSITNIPPFLVFNKVYGNFICSKNKLTSLENAPKEVTGYFDVGFNKLTSLDGAPVSVGMGFNCDGNNLTDLKGSPKGIGGSFICSNNNLTSLEGSPEYVIDFSCSYNNLTSLKGCPKEIGGRFVCSNNNLTDLKGGPKSMSKKLYCKGNPIGSILDEVDIEFIIAFNSFRILTDGVVYLKRLKYLMSLFGNPINININKIKKHYTIK